MRGVTQRLRSALRRGALHRYADSQVIRLRFLVPPRREDGLVFLAAALVNDRQRLAGMFRHEQLQIAERKHALPVDPRDQISAFEAGLFRRIALRDRVDAGQIDTGRPDHDQGAEKAEQEVEKRPREQYLQAHPGGLFLQKAVHREFHERRSLTVPRGVIPPGIRAALFLFVLFIFLRIDSVEDAGASEQDRPQRKFGAAAPERKEFRAETDPELGDIDPVFSGHEKMPELVHEHDQADDQNTDDNSGGAHAPSRNR